MKLADGTWDPFDDYVLDFAVERMRVKERVALVTLVEIEGSSPRPLGAQMAVSETGQWVGYLSGGCIERAIAAEAVDALASGRSRRVRYGRGSRYIDISLPCGSAIELVFDVRMPLARLEAVDARLRRRQRATLAVPLGGPSIDGAGDEERCFIRSYLPRRRLVILGLGPVPVHLARLAAAAGLEVVLHTPDELTADAVRGLPVTLGPPGEAAKLGEADNRTAIVFAFHDHDREERLLPLALASGAFYIGAMGSRTTQDRRLEQLRQQGFGKADLERIHGPAGLLPHARNAGDLALSILAQVIEAARHDEEVVVAGPAAALPPFDFRRGGPHEAPSEARL